MTDQPTNQVTTGNQASDDQANQTTSDRLARLWTFLSPQVSNAITEAQDARQAIEDTRANRRNRNRMLTLLGALLIGIVVTFVLTHGYMGAASKTYGPYAFVITVALDSLITVYAYVRHY